MKKVDVFIAGTGCSGLYCALNLPRNKKILMITKSDLESSDSFLAQGGISMLKDEKDYDSYFEDTVKAGHYENDLESVEIMIRSSKDVVKDLILYGVDFQKDEKGDLDFTREGAHSKERILFHKDITGKEITSKLLERVKELPNVELVENTLLTDLLCKDNRCYGAVIQNKDREETKVIADHIVLATGGIGGIYPHSTNFKHMTVDALLIAMKYGIERKDMDYVQFHPTTFYTKNKEERSFLISESVRGEGAKLYDKDKKPFVDELLPRDLLTEAIYKQMEMD